MELCKHSFCDFYQRDIYKIAFISVKVHLYLI